MPSLSFNIDAVIDGRARLTDAQALELHHAADIHDLGRWAHERALRMHTEDYRTYVIDRNINYTNVCTARCTFCAFRRDAGESDSYALSNEDIGRKIRELVAINGTQVLMQGGMNPQLPIEYYEDLLRYIKSQFPSIHIHAFSPPEFVEFERFFNMDVRQILRRFRAAGLDTIPGGGGEIFAPRCAAASASASARPTTGSASCASPTKRACPPAPPCSSATSSSSASGSSTWRRYGICRIMRWR